MMVITSCLSTSERGGGVAASGRLETDGRAGVRCSVVGAAAERSSGRTPGGPRKIESLQKVAGKHKFDVTKRGTESESTCYIG